ncbi:hypothetical protein V2K05_11710 [Pseudomonas alliivorans]|nr:hypothetical protein [Pseudomonas alliivorans]MEE4963391.1 hypothetical protein [Pseudomonas alliivorans]MEE4972988.1 hypothetical protein [Pseudomonas alliivorans]MEE4983697.1 hypothetical protein [Pseudomonas alliivorans]MEE5002504.1 hypothetical protein [Pseudomonas alliivorans]
MMAGFLFVSPGFNPCAIVFLMSVQGSCLSAALLVYRIYSVVRCLYESSIDLYEGEKISINYGSFTVSGGAVLPPNQIMRLGQFLQSPNERFKLDLQADGNLVVKDNGAVVWVADGNQPCSNTLSRRLMRAPWVVVSTSCFLYDPARAKLGIAEGTHAKDTSYWYPQPYVC